MRDSVVAASLVQFGLLGTLAVSRPRSAAWATLLLVYYWSAASIQGAALAAAGLGLLASSVLERGHRRTDRRLPVDDRRPGIWAIARCGSGRLALRRAAAHGRRTSGRAALSRPPSPRNRRRREERR